MNGIRVAVPAASLAADIRLRPGEAGDSAAVARILIESRLAFMPYAPSAHSSAEVRAWVADTLLPSGGVRVATLGSGVVGVLAMASGEDGDWITQLSVAPQYVGCGIGDRLLALALAELAGPIRLYTFQANTGARRFYARHGFAEIELSDGQGNEEGCPDVLLRSAAS